MRFMQLRINYTDNNSHFYQELAVPLQRLMATRYFYRWSIARRWQNGPHYLLTFDASTLFYRGELQKLIVERVNLFLQSFPSAPLNIANYLALQAKLNKLVASGIDPDVIEPNNTATVSFAELEQLAAKYESPGQWLSVFDTEISLRKALIAHWAGADAAMGERFVFDLMTLLACVYPPAPSDDPEVFEYNGFLSFHSNYLFWRHALKPEQQATIDPKFSEGYAATQPRYTQWLHDLEATVAEPSHPCSELGQILLQGFLDHCRLAQEGVIHARSPFPREKLADKEQVSAFHQRHFYDEEGSAKAFGLEFCAYRWLLNIVYRTLPLLNISPMARQMLNYSLNELQQEQAPTIRSIRARMLTTGMPRTISIKATA